MDQEGKILPQSEKYSEKQGSSSCEDEPDKKRIKLLNSVVDINTKNHINTLQINTKILDEDYVNQLENKWITDSSYQDCNKNVVLYTNPFRLCVLQDFLANTKLITEMVNEMYSIEWSRKQMDLYEFYQSTDLCNVTAPLLKEFFSILQTTVKPIIEKISQLKLSHVSASCSMYSCGDYLLVHDDLLNDRQVAFVFYLSPWDGVETWRDEMGGCLEIFKSDSNCHPHFPVIYKIHPKNNQFVFFKVGSKSFHQVGEVTTFDYPRLTINGWFHGGTNSDAILDETPAASLFSTPLLKDYCLHDWINTVYLQEETKRDIQNYIEHESEICLKNFLLDRKYNEMLEELKSNNNLKWTLKGPANVQCYEILDLKKLSGAISEFIEFLSSKAIFKLLQQYTDLELDAPVTGNPTYFIEVQRWNQGYYTILSDRLTDQPTTLDVTLYLNVCNNVGTISYLDPTNEPDGDRDLEDAVLLKTENNALNIIYRTNKIKKFTKYVSKNTRMPNKHVFIVVASYQE